MAGLELKFWELISYCLIFVLGFMGNLSVCLVIWRSRSSLRQFRRVPFNVYLMSLAIADLTLAVVCLPVYIMSTAVFPHPEGTKGDVFCKIITGYFMPFWFAEVSIYTLVIISFDRYYAICKPFLAMTRTTSKATAFHIAGAWSIGFILEVPVIIGVRFSQWKPSSSTGNYCAYNWANEGTSTTVFAVVFAFNYLVPAVIFVVNFYRIQRCLKKMNSDLKGCVRDSPQRLRIMRNKKKTVKIVFVVSAVFFLCWTPNKVMYFLFQYRMTKKIHWNSDLYQVGIILGFLNSCVNPYFYAFQSRIFRYRCKEVITKMFRINV